MAGPFGSNGIRARTEEVAAEAFAELEKLRATIAAGNELVAQRLEGVQQRQERGSAISRMVSETADGATPAVAKLEPSQGTLWVVTGIAVAADAGADRAVAIGLGGDPLALPLLGLTTVAANGGIAGQLGEWTLPAGGGIAARFAAAVPAGTRVRLHVLAHELATDL